MFVDSECGGPEGPRTLIQDTIPHLGCPCPPWKSYLLSNFNPQTDSHTSPLPPKVLTLVTGIVPTLGGQAPTGWTRSPQLYRPAILMVSNPCIILENKSWMSVPRLGVQYCTVAKTMGSGAGTVWEAYPFLFLYYNLGQIILPLCASVSLTG